MRAIRYQAAGGIVVVEEERVLVLRRPSRDEIRLPKGHIEKGESAQETALREVAEESGYDNLETLADLGHQTVEFNYNGVHVIRKERYFLMRPQTLHQAKRKEKELQFIPDWLDWDEALSALSFEAEREWVRRAQKASRPPQQPPNP